MEVSMLRTMSACITAFAFIAGPSVGYAQNRADGPALQQLSAADVGALTDARINLVKAALGLTSEQERYWPAIEEVIRSRAKSRETRLAAVASRAAALRDRSPIEVL